MSSADRRRAPRVEILGRLHGHVKTVGVPVTVREISLGGLSMEAAAAFPIGAVYEFSLTMGDDSAVLVRGRVVYSREHAMVDTAPVYMTGIQFIDEESEDDATVSDLIDRLS